MHRPGHTGPPGIFRSMKINLGLQGPAGDWAHLCVRHSADHKTALPHVPFWKQGAIQREVTHGMGVLWCAGRSERALDSSAARCYVHHSLVNTFHDTALPERCTETLLGNRLPAILSTAFEASSQNRHFTSFKRARQHLAIARRATHTETRGDPGCSRLSVFLFLFVFCHLIADIYVSENSMQAHGRRWCSVCHFGSSAQKAIRKI